MNKIFFIIISLFFSVGLLNGQSLFKPILLGENSPYFEDTDMLFHRLERTSEMFKNDPKGYFAVRVCSNDPLPVAFENAAGVNYGVNIIKQQLNGLQRFDPIKFSEPNIYFLRNDKGCRFYKGISLTEYWFVSSNADFPDYKEIKAAESIESEPVIFDYESMNKKFVFSGEDDLVSLNPALYESLKLKLFDILKNNKTAFVNIKYFVTSGRNKNFMRNEALKLQKYLTDRNVGKYRIFVRECVIGCGFNPESENVLYPNVSIIYQ